MRHERRRDAEAVMAQHLDQRHRRPRARVERERAHLVDRHARVQRDRRDRPARPDRRRRARNGSRAQCRYSIDGIKPEIDLVRRAAARRTPPARRSEPPSVRDAVERPGQRTGIQIPDGTDANACISAVTIEAAVALDRLEPGRLDVAANLLERRAAAAFGRFVGRRDAVRCRRRRRSAPPARASGRSAASRPESSGCSARPDARSPPSSHRRSRSSAGTRGDASAAG